MKSKITSSGVELIAETTEESLALMFLLDVKSDTLFRSRIDIKRTTDVDSTAYFGSNEEVEKSQTGGSIV